MWQGQDLCCRTCPCCHSSTGPGDARRHLQLLRTVNKMMKDLPQIPNGNIVSKRLNTTYEKGNGQNHLLLKSEFPYNRPFSLVNFALPIQISVLEITVDHRTLSDQISRVSGQFHIMIGHDDRTSHQHILSYILQGFVSQ